MNKTPAIRLNGYSKEWIPHKLPEMCSIFADGDWIEAKDQSEAGIRLIQTGNIGTTVYNDKPKNKKWITAETFEKLHCSEVFPGDILISRLPEPAGRACIIPAVNDRMITAVDCTIARCKDAYCADFLVQYLATAKYFKEVNTCLAGGTRQRISRGNLSQFDVYTPFDYKEQAKIGETFKFFDQLVLVHERKLEKLVLTKKAMLLKMFPQNGDTVPEIRFNGFEGNWEQRKFSDMFSERCDKTTTENEDVLLSCAITGMFLNSELFGHFRGSTTIGYLKVRKNDLILSAQNLHLGNANVNLRFEHGIISPAYKVYDLIDCEPHFVNAWVKKDTTKNFFLSATTEGASQCRKNIEWDTLNQQTILCPSFEEQKKIGEFFNNLDNLIALQEAKIEKLKRTKKALLAKMFV